MGLAEEADLEELIRQKEALVAERDRQVQAIVALRSEVRDAEQRCRRHSVYLVVSSQMQLCQAPVVARLCRESKAGVAQCCCCRSYELAAGARAQC